MRLYLGTVVLWVKWLSQHANMHAQNDNAYMPVFSRCNDYHVHQFGLVCQYTNNKLALNTKYS